MKRELTSLLNSWGFPTGTYAQLAATGDGMALLANLVNLSAKIVDEAWYDMKPAIVSAALQAADHASLSQSDDGYGCIAYIETAVGQVSFHLFLENEEVFDPLRSPMEWSGEETQAYAVDLIREYLDLEGANDDQTYELGYDAAARRLSAAPHHSRTVCRHHPRRRRG